MGVEDKAELPARAGPRRAWWAGFGDLLPTEDTRELPSESGSHGWGHISLPFHLLCFGFNLSVGESFQENRREDPQELREGIWFSFSDCREPVSSPGPGSPALIILGRKGPHGTSYSGSLL